MTAEPAIEVEIAGTGDLSLCTRARHMVVAGADPAALVVWTRRGVPVFTAPASLGWWCDREVTEGVRPVAMRLRSAQERTAWAEEHPPAPDNAEEPVASPEPVGELV